MRALVLLVSVLAAPAPAQTPPPLRLRGRVVDSAGAPLLGAGLVVGAPGQALTATALEQPLVRTGADGRFELTVPHLPEGSAGTPAHVLVAAPGKAALRWPQSELEPPTERAGEPVDLGDVALPDGVTLRGQVRGDGGRPLAGARVRGADLIGVRQNLGDGSGGSSRLFASYAVTQADGSFQLAGVFPTLLEVRVDAPGYYTRAVAPVTARDPVVLELTPSGFVTGRLLDADGKATAGTIAVSYEVEHYTQDLATAPDGSFRVPIRFPVRFRLHGWVPGEESRRMAEGPVLSGPKDGVELRLKGTAAESRGRKLLLRVLDAAGRPQPAARACALWMEASNFDPTYLQNLFDQGMVAADGQGIVRLPGPDEDDHQTALVRVLAPGCAPGTIQEVALKEDAQTPLEVRLRPQSVLAGVVRDAQGQEPVAGAEVRVVALPEHKPGQPLVMLGGAGNQLGRTVRTGADGTFRVEQLGPGRHEVFARAKDRPETRVAEFALGEGETRGDLQCTLARGATLRGRVTGQNPGPAWKVRLEPLDPVQEAPFTVTFPGGNGDAPGLQFELAADGSFVAPGLRRGNYHLHLMLPVAARTGRALSVPIEPLRVRGRDLTREFDAAEDVPARVRGRVTVTGARVPLERLLVGVLQAQSDGGAAWFGQHAGAELSVRRALLDEQGRFELPLGPGTYQLAVVDAATGVRLLLDDHKLELKPGAQVEQDLTVAAVKLQVRLVREDGARIVASRLQVEAGAKDGGGRGFDGGDTGVGLDLAEAPGDVTLFVPPGPVKLLAHGQPWRLQRGNRTLETQPLGELELDAQAGDLRTVELKVQPPVEIPDDSDDKPGKGGVIQFDDVGPRR